MYGCLSLAICDDYNVMKYVKKDIWIPTVYPKKRFFSVQNTETNNFLFQVFLIFFSKR